MKVAKGKKTLLKKLNKNIGSKIDELEKKMAESDELLVFPLIHRFSDGLYSREVTLGKGCLVTSKTHKVQHQFFLLSGSVLIFDNEGKANYVSAPYVGITEVNTRRVVYAIEDTIWITCHPNPENDITQEIEKIIFEDYSNNLLTDEMRKKILEVQKKSKQISKTITTKALKSK